MNIIITLCTTHTHTIAFIMLTSVGLSGDSFVAGKHLKLPNINFAQSTCRLSPLLLYFRSFYLFFPLHFSHLLQFNPTCRYLSVLTEGISSFHTPIFVCLLSDTCWRSRPSSWPVLWAQLIFSHTNINSYKLVAPPPALMHEQQGLIRSEWIALLSRFYCCAVDMWWEGLICSPLHVNCSC